MNTLKILAIAFLATFSFSALAETRFDVVNLSNQTINLEIRGSGVMNIPPDTQNWFSWSHPDPMFANAARCQRGRSEFHCTVAGDLWVRFNTRNCTIEYGRLQNHRIVCS